MDVIEQGRPALPDAVRLLQAEIRHRAALGEASEVSDLLDQVLLTLPGTASVSSAITAAVEYRAHEHPDLAGGHRSNALDWLASQPAEEHDSAAHRDMLGRVLYALGRWEEALPLFEGLVADQPDAVHRLGQLGTTLARPGRRDEALGIGERLRTLATPYLYGAHSRWRAQIHALLGDSAHAVRVLRQAIGEGTAYPALHGLPDFAALRSYGPFAELMRPRG